VQLLAVIPRHERRIRLSFNLAVAMGGFVTPPTFYTVTNTDGKGISPGVVKVFVVANSPDVVELQLDGDLVGGALYTVSAVGVPGVDASVTPNPSILPFFFGENNPQPKPTGQSGISDLDAVLYGIDLLFHGDFLETPDGDLAVVSGTTNLRESAWRRALSEGLPWTPDFGVHPREFVDATPGSLGALRGRAESQMRRDDRVKTASAILVTDVAQAFLSISVIPIGAGQVDSLNVPLSK